MNEVFDYTEEGYRARQSDLAIAYLNLIDNKMTKINRKLTFITAVIVGVTLYKHKDVIREFKKVKGE